MNKYVNGIKVKYEQCVVRTFPYGYTNTTGYLEKLLDLGWIVKHISPFNISAERLGNEYILERPNEHTD
jgi:hypothetical protein